MTIENRIAGALAGMVLGDALGVPGELWPREKVRARFGHIDTFLDGPEDNIVACYFKAGHYTDDSAQAFVILKALLKAGTVPPVKVLADDLIAWVESMNGFEINLLGPSSKASLLAHSRGEDYTKYTKLSLTNGAGMRIAPVGCLVDWNDSEKLAETVARVSIVTHGTDVAIGGAAMVAQAVASGIGGRSWEEAAEDALRIWNVARAKGEPTWAASVAERFRLALSVMKDFDDDEKFSRWVYDILGTGTMTSESVSAAPTRAATPTRSVRWPARSAVPSRDSMRYPNRARPSSRRQTRSTSAPWRPKSPAPARPFTSEGAPACEASAPSSIRSSLKSASSSSARPSSTW